MNFANSGQGSVGYLSNTVCDEFIIIMGDNLRAQFIQEVQVSSSFALIVDSTPMYVLLISSLLYLGMFYRTDT